MVLRCSGPQGVNGVRGIKEAQKRRAGCLQTEVSARACHPRAMGISPQSRAWAAVGTMMRVGSTFPSQHKGNNSHVRHKQESKWARSFSESQTLGTRVTCPATPWALRDPLKGAGTVPQHSHHLFQKRQYSHCPRPRGAPALSCHSAPGLGEGAGL